MTTIVTRSGKGSPLSNTELDQNFINLNTDKLEYIVETTASTTSLTPSIDTTQSNITALAADLTINNPSGGTPADSHKFILRIKDNGTIRNLSWGTIYRGVGSTLPIATVAGKILYMGFVYNDTDSKMDLVSVMIQD